MPEGGNIDAEIDGIYDRLDALLWASNFDAVDDILLAAASNPPNAAVGIAMLTITRTAKEKLPSRLLFRWTVEEQLESLGEDPRTSLYGL